ncbi:30S ribosomal protein S9 [Candidatus Woesearchaeota archaeon]|jgi:small subunit ribosomal protein S9|nr:30S ribosomal protein S9 [Candidatus Woesearchaeota archaeon]
MKPIHVSGKRKRAIARATLKPGTGKIRINKIPLNVFQPEMSRLKITEPLILAGEQTKKIDIDINVIGGGISSQVEAARLVIGKALSKFDSKLEPVLLKYDKHLLIADVRRKETSKPNRHGKARAKRQKSYR